MKGNYRVIMPKPISDVIKKNVRSVLVSNPNGVALNELLKDYQKLLYVKLNFSALGYQNLVEFLDAMPDVAKLEWWQSKQTYRIFAVVDPNHYLPTFLKGNTKQLNEETPPVVPLSQHEFWEEKLSPNLRGQYAVCFRNKANHTREEIADDFGTVGEVAATSFANKYNSKEEAMAALETLEYKYHASPSEERANPHQVFKMKDAYQKPMKRGRNIEMVEIFVGSLARDTSAEEVLQRIEPNLVYQYRDVQKEDKHFMFLIVKRESVDKVIASLHHKFIGGKKIIAQLAFAYEDNTVNNKDHSLDMKAAIDTKVVKGHLGMFNQFDYEQASSIEDVETCSFDTNGEHDWPEPPLPDLEPALPELEPVMPELEPAMPDLELVYDYDPTGTGLLGASPQQMAYGQSPNCVQPMHQMANRKRNVHSNTGSQCMHQDQLQVNQSSTNHRHSHQRSAKKNSAKSAIPQAAHSNRKIRKVAANGLSNGQDKYLPMCDEQALLAGFLDGSAIVHLANFHRNTTWTELMEVFTDLKPLRIEVDSSSLDCESTYAAMIMKSVMDADAALSYNNMTLNGRTLFVYRSESAKSMEEGDVEMEGDADVLADIPTSLKVNIKNTRVRDANGDEAEGEGSWMEQQIVSRFVRAVSACCPDCELWTPADLTSTSISIAITGVIDDTYISGQVIDIATREEHKWLSDMFPLMQMEDAQMMYTLGSKTCAALYEGEWFRGYVEEVKFDTASVFAIDYGNVVKQPVKKLRDFPVVLWEVTAQAWPIKVVSSVFDNLQQLDQMKVHAEVLNPNSMTFPLNVHITGIVEEEEEEEEEEDTAADNPGTSSAASLCMRSAMRSGLSRPQPAKHVKFAS